jgi:hypothetical protein
LSRGTRAAATPSWTSPAPAGRPPLPPPLLNVDGPGQLPRRLARLSPPFPLPDQQPQAATPLRDVWPSWPPSPFAARRGHAGGSSSRWGAIRRRWSRRARAGTPASPAGRNSCGRPATAWPPRSLAATAYQPSSGKAAAPLPGRRAPNLVLPRLRPAADLLDDLRSRRRGKVPGSRRPPRCPRRSGRVGSPSGGPASARRGAPRADQMSSPTTAYALTRGRSGPAAGAAARRSAAALGVSSYRCAFSMFRCQPAVIRAGQVVAMRPRLPSVSSPRAPLTYRTPAASAPGRDAVPLLRGVGRGRHRRVP